MILLLVRGYWLINGSVLYCFFNQEITVFCETFTIERNQKESHEGWIMRGKCEDNSSDSLQSIEGAVCGVVGLR
jgi:hypothetical protein